MKAAFYDGSGKMQVSNYPDPTAGPGEVVIKLKSTGICGSDLNMNKAKTAADDHPAGQHGARHIIKKKSKVDKSFIGERVAVEV